MNTAAAGLHERSRLSAAPDADVDRSHAWDWGVLVASVFLTVMPVVLDLFTTRVNLAILLIAPLVLTARLGRPGLLAAWGGACVVLAYGTFFLETLYLEPSSPWSYRLVNRSLVAIAIAAATGLLLAWLRVRRRLLLGGPIARKADPEQEVFNEVLRSVEAILAACVVLLYVIVVATADLLLPGQYNLPILYVIPLLICATVRDRRVMWTVALVLIGLSAIGFAVGRALTVPQTLAGFVLTNRTLAMVMLLSVACFLHLWIGRQPADQRRPAGG